MQRIEVPKANPEKLLTIIQEAYHGKVVIPEFQRSFIWSREDIEQFLASILQGYFVGTFLVLDTPVSNPMFPFRAVEGLEKVNADAHPDQHQTVRLILDGQQRITSMFYALYGPDLPLRGSTYPHKFYLRLDEALAGDIDEAVVAVSTRDQRRVAEIQQLVSDQKALPFTLLRESDAFHRWLYQEQRVWKDSEQRRIGTLYQRLQEFMVPVVSLSPEAGRDNIVNIFERINRAGVSLSLFDLLVARLYLKGVKLRDLWKAFEEQHKSITAIVKPEFLVKVIAIIKGKEPRKGTLLDVLDALDTGEFQRLWREAADAIRNAHERIMRYYGGIAEAWIPYTTMIVPLAALLDDVKRVKAGEEAYRKVDCWYWASVFGQRYDSAVDTKSYQDVRDVGQWIRGNVAPDWLKRLALEPDDFNVEERRSAIYRGIMCLIVRREARDFLTGQPVPLGTWQDDHIFPRALYKDSPLANTILNRTLISKETNNYKRDKTPSEFLQECLAGHGGDEARLRETLRSHFITEEAYRAMQRNDLEGFIKYRRQALQEAVGAVLSVPGIRESTEQNIENNG